MSSPTLDDALAAFDAGDYDECLSLYSSLLSSSPANGSLYLHRSNVQLKLQHYQAALDDANKAIEFGSTSQYAFFRKASALFYLDEFEEAKRWFEEAAKAGNKQTDLWIRKCDAELERTQPSSSSSSSSLSSSTSTSASTSVAKPPIATSMAAAVDAAATSHASSAVATSSASSSSAAAVPSKPLAEKVPPFQHVMSRSLVTITEYTKNITRSQVSVSIDEETGQLYRIEAQMPDGSVYLHELKLYAPVQRESMVVNVNAYKVEVVLKKKVDEDWPGLEADAAARLPPNVVKRENVIREDAKVSYPSSAPKKVDWDGVEKDVKKAEEEEKPEGEAALQKLFQTIYKDASDETRRAMVKSFQTSGGTVLSTNWKEVQDTDYTKNRQAPAGQEFRDWNNP